MNDEDMIYYDEKYKVMSQDILMCSILCGTNPKPTCYGDYPNCRLQYRGLEENVKESADPNTRNEDR